MASHIVITSASWDIHISYLGAPCCIGIFSHHTLTLERQYWKSNICIKHVDFSPAGPQISNNTCVAASLATPAWIFTLQSLLLAEILKHHSLEIPVALAHFTSNPNLRTAILKEQYMIYQTCRFLAGWATNLKSRMCGCFPSYPGMAFHIVINHFYWLRY